MKRIKWEDAMEAYDMLDDAHDLDSSWTGRIVRQYLEQPDWTFTAGVALGMVLGGLLAIVGMRA